MSKYSDKFYEMLHKNSVKRRRMVTLLLVLSTFTASSVVWTLRDTGITMANKDDDDFSSLTASLGNSPTALAPEAQAASDGLGQVYYYPITQEQRVDNIARGINISMFDYTIFRYDTWTEGEGDDQQERHAWTPVEGEAYINAENAGDRIQSKQGINSFYWAGADDTGIYFFPYSTPPVHSNTQIGTIDITNDSNETVTVNKYEAGTPGKNNYSGDYSKGTQNNDPYWSVQSGNRPVQGIVQSELASPFGTADGNSSNQIYGDDGKKYPVVKSGANGEQGISLAYLFNNQPLYQEYANNQGVAGTQYKWVYEKTNGLLHEKNGHLRYSSNENYAILNTTPQNGVYYFDVLDETFRIINDDHHYADDKNNLRDGKVYGKTVDEKFMIGFFPFDSYDRSKTDPNWNARNPNDKSSLYNHHFGMKMDAKFKLPSSKKYNGEAITFSYSGDDDMWVFIDGNLVLDIGGIHEPAAGMIDFTNGLVWVQDNANNPSNSSAKSGSDLAAEISGLIGSPVTVEQLDTGAFPTPAFGFTTHDEQGSGTKWIVKRITDVYSGWEDFKSDGTPHQLDMFYLERGGCYSNLSVDMNLPTMGNLNVGKSVNFGSHISDEYDERLYEFKVEKIVENTDGTTNTSVLPLDNCLINGAPIPSDHIDSSEGLFKLKANEIATFQELEAGDNIKYRVCEKSTDGIVQKAVINGSDIYPQSGFISSNAYTLAQKPTFGVENVIRDEKTSITVKKQWASGSNYTSDEIYFKVYRWEKDINGNKDVSTKTPIAIDGKFTQTLKRNGVWEDVVFNDLTYKYGDKEYVYTVEEVTPDGFTSDYRTGSNGELIMVNTPIDSSTNIYVEKKWVHSQSTDIQPVTIQLKRLYRESTSPAGATVNVVVKDSGGATIETQTITNAYQKGSVEFNVVLAGYDNAIPKVDSVTEGVKVTQDKNVFELDNLAATTTITLRYNESGGSAGPGPEGSKIVYQNRFESYSDAVLWTPSNGVENSVFSSGNGKYSLTDGAGVNNITAQWQGAQFSLAGLGLDPAKTYTFVIYAKPDDGKTQQIQFALHSSSQLNIKADWGTSSNTWNKLIFTVLANTISDWSDCYVKVQDGTGDNGFGKFYFDDFLIVEGEGDISVNQSDGSVQLPSVLYEVDFTSYSTSDTSAAEDEMRNNWNTWGGSGDAGIGTAGGVAHFDVRQAAELKYYLTYGNKYTVTAELKYGENQTCSDVDLKLKGYRNGKDRYVTVGKGTSTGNTAEYTWTIDLTNSIGSGDSIIDSSSSNITLYLERNDGFSIEKFKLDGGNSSSIPAKTGGSLSVAVNEVANSNTKPPTELGGFELDTSFVRTVTLDGTVDNNGEYKAWFAKWENIDQVPGREFKYYVIETQIGNNVPVTNSYGGDKLPENINGSETFAYNIVYLGNGVSVSSEDEPITIENTYIWYQLPNTGGMGTTKVYILGVFLIAAGVLGGYTIRKRERRSG